MTRHGPIAVGVLATALSSWWLAGLVLHGESDLFSPDYLLDPPEISAGVEHAIGVVSVVVACLGLMAFVRLTRGPEPSRAWAGVYGTLALSSAYLGFVYRVAILPVGGANIGGALLILSLFPVTLGLWAMALIFGIKATRHVD